MKHAGDKHPSSHAYSWDSGLHSPKQVPNKELDKGYKLFINFSGNVDNQSLVPRPQHYSQAFKKEEYLPGISAHFPDSPDLNIPNSVPPCTSYASSFP